VRRTARTTARRLSWARLLERVFDIDMQHCPNCGSDLKFIAAIVEAPVIGKILTHLGLQARAAPRAPARGQALPTPHRSRPPAKTDSSPLVPCSECHREEEWALENNPPWPASAAKGGSGRAGGEGEELANLARLSSARTPRAADELTRS
jgi:hypothetical protein